MKKLVFAAFAAFVMVSVSNVFAGSSKAELGLNMPVDSTVVDTADTVGAPAEGEPAEQQATPEEVAMLSDSVDSVDSTAHLFSSVMLMDSTSTDTTGTEAPAVVYEKVRVSDINNNTLIPFSLHRSCTNKNGADFLFSTSNECFIK